MTDKAGEKQVETRVVNVPIPCPNPHTLHGGYTCPLCGFTAPLGGGNGEK